MKWCVVFLLLDLLLWASIVEAEHEAKVLPLLGSVSKAKKREVLRRSKRSLLNFHSVIRCFQPWVSVLDVYGDYGCFCGFRGHGRPLDDTDMCCYKHDYCYADAEKKASTFTEWSMGTYFTSYYFKCTENNTVSCNETLNNEYQQAICECDRQAAECFLMNRKSYSKKLFDINVEKYCKEEADFNDFQLNRHTLSKFYTCKLKPDQDKCCVDKGYNSAYEICCDGNLARLPSTVRENYECCGGQWYDNRRKICCYGALHPNFPHLKCCGKSGAKVDTTKAKCVDGEVVSLSTDKEFFNTTAVH